MESGLGQSGNGEHDSQRNRVLQKANPRFPSLKRLLQSSRQFEDVWAPAVLLTMPDSAQPETRRRLPTWMVILCIVMGIAVVEVVIMLPYYRQQRAIGYFEAVGGKIRTEPGGPEWLRRLVGDKRMQHFDRVSEVNVKGTSVTDAGLVHLRALANLEYLDLSKTGITDEGLTHVVGLTHLIRLHLDETGVTGAGLANLHGMKNLDWLILGTGVTDAGLVHVRALTNLKYLHLSGSGITNAGLAHVERLTNLTMLDIDRTGITDAGLVHISGLTKISTLILYKTGVTDTGLVHLSGLIDLYHLNLAATGITDAGLVHLRGLKNLAILKIGETGITNEGVEKLETEIPNCYITRNDAAFF